MDVEMNIKLKDLENSSVKLDAIKYQKMVLLFNAIEQGWSVKKHNSAYVFTKPHEKKKEVVEEQFLIKFMKANLDIKV